MRCLERNKRTFYYSLLTGSAPKPDGMGRELVYGDPVMMRANIAPATGASSVEQFGNDIEYHKVIVTDDINCPIDENTLLFIDVRPTKDDDGEYVFDYIVKRVAKSLNSISIAISKVDVS